MAARPVFGNPPRQFPIRPTAAAGIALINSVATVDRFAACDVIGALKNATSSYIVPMFIVGCFLLHSGPYTGEVRRDDVADRGCVGLVRPDVGQHPDV